MVVVITKHTSKEKKLWFVIFFAIKKYITNTVLDVTLKTRLYTV